MSNNMSSPSQNWKYYLCAELVDSSGKKSNDNCVYPTLEEDNTDYNYLDNQYRDYCQNNSVLFQKLDEFVGDEQAIAPGKYTLSRILFVNSSNDSHRKEHYMGINLSWDGRKFTQLSDTPSSGLNNNTSSSSQTNYLPRTGFHCLPDGVLFEDN